MADPRTFTVKQCPPAYAQKSGAGIGSATSTRRDFANAIGKIGDLEVLNSVGAGKIGQGLRTLAGISNTIRQGQGALPSSIGSTIDAGANWVLEQTGMAPTMVDALRNFNPGIANQALGQAKAIFEQVQQGNFKTTDIPGYLQDLQNFERLGRNIFTPGKEDAQSSLGARCEASPYAIDMIARAPKFKFLFIVEFIPTMAYANLQGGTPILDMAFVVKTSTRPNIKFHTEDVNYYNYRTNFITKTIFDEMTMTFHDDNTNAATQFYTSYLKAVSPIANLDPNRGYTEPGHLKYRGMEFNDSTLSQPGRIANGISANAYAASRGPLQNDATNVFAGIRLYHVYDYGNKMTIYDFMNPRIVTLAPSDLDMSTSDPSELSITFSYDSVYVDPEVDLKSTSRNIADLQPGAVYPLKYNGGATPGGQPNIPNVPISPPPGATPSFNPMSQINNATATVQSAGRAAVAAVSDLSQKFSNFL